MRFFASQILKPYILSHGYKDILEIGSARGQNADQIMASDPEVRFSIVDPCVSADLTDKYKNNPRVKLLKGLSLEVLPKLHGKYDCILIDGDHNWHTVYNELSNIEKNDLLKKGGTIFLHDVAWPYARRDMYYDPENIPETVKLPHAKKGIVRGRSQLVESGGFNAEVDNALHEGGPKNGVLTAVEDFLAGKDQYVFFSARSQYGLGVIIKKDDNYFTDFLKWYLKIRIFDLKTFMRPFTKKIKLSVN